MTAIADIANGFGLTEAQVEAAVNSTKAKMKMVLAAWERRDDLGAFSSIMLALMEAIEAEGMEVAAQLVSDIAARLEGDRRMVLERAAQAIRDLIVLNAKIGDEA